MSVREYAVIMFADLIGSARLADTLPPKQYNRVLAELHEIAEDIKNRILDRYQTSECLSAENTRFDIKGDEVLFMVANPRGYSPKHLACLRNAIVAAFEIAISLKARWALSNCNISRLESEASPFSLAIGLHYGPVFRDRRKEFCGFAISFAKRVETVSRAGRGTRIAVSQSFLSACRETGVPIEHAQLLEAPLKGFEDAEPVFELLSQYVISDDEVAFTRPGKRRSSQCRHYLLKLFRRDPNRSLWLLELAIDRLFLTREYDEAINQLGIPCLQIVSTPSLYYRTARCLHRDRQPQRAIDFYRTAGRALLWGKLDQAAAHWTIARSELETDKQWSEVRWHAICHQLREGLHLCSQVIMAEPLHFYAYNLRALIAAEGLRIRPSGPDLKAQALSSHSSAVHDVDLAAKLNPNPSYLYSGTRAHLAAAIEQLDQMILCLDEADHELDRHMRVHGENLPSEHYWQPGFAVPAAVPPRPKQLKDRWSWLRSSPEVIKVPADPSYIQMWRRIWEHF